MEKSQKLQMDRRKFVSNVLPVCAITCIGLDKYSSMASSINDLDIFQEIHKFDREIERRFTYRQFMTLLSRSIIDIARVTEEDLGSEKMIETIRKATDTRMIHRGNTRAIQFPDTSLKSYTAQFKAPQAQSALTFEIVEDNDRIFEINVKGCIYAAVFRQLKSEDIGYAAVCRGDFSWSAAFISKIKRIRDKTLMQGESCCNHKYVMVG